MVSSDNIVRPLAWFVAVESAISAIIAPIAVRLVERVRELKAELEPFRRTLKLLSADTAAADASDVLAYQRDRKPLGEVVSAIALIDTYKSDGISENPWKVARSMLRTDPDAVLLGFLSPSSPSPGAA
jgi:hypothetical protein